MSLRHSGQGLVVGGAAGTGFLNLFKRAFTGTTTKK
jgi:hypothetical protein